MGDQDSPILKKIPIAALMRVSGRPRSMLKRTLAGRSRPRQRNQGLLKSILNRLGGGLDVTGLKERNDDFASTSLLVLLSFRLKLN